MELYFYLVENPNDIKLPFAFMATYTSKDNSNQFPIKKVFEENDDHNGEKRALFSIINQISLKSDLIHKWLNDGDIFYPIKLSDTDAYLFLKEISLYESFGVICRVPKWHHDNSNKIKFDFKEKLKLGTGILNPLVLNMLVPELIYHDEIISVEEAHKLLSYGDGLHLIKGKWIEVNVAELAGLLNEYEELSECGFTLPELLNRSSNLNTNEESFVDFSQDDWFEYALEVANKEVKSNKIPRSFDGVLRNYQVEAFYWMSTLSSLGLGMCLADDMGLGKTVEVLSFLTYLKSINASSVLLVVPATLVANWTHEIEKFAPELDYSIIRASDIISDKPKTFITIMTYQGMAASKSIKSIEWDALILDEAQAIKNYYTNTSKQVKKIKANIRIAMTGTPIENNLLELWSIFGFLNPGYLGKKDDFMDRYVSNPSDKDLLHLKEMIKPFVLRRLKTDKSIIPELPEKLEIKRYINLSKEQIVLYREVINHLNVSIENAYEKASTEEQYERSKDLIIINTLTKLKQICNHPSQYYGLCDYPIEKSGKFIELINICETISANKEKVIVFTQYKEIIPALVKTLEEVFNSKGAYIDGTVSMQKRDSIVTSFQNGDIPFLVLSIKTGGVGLTLTEASNVIHFDRWWNPAVENQATDRVYRIGQKKDVVVYKFITSNTLEEAIDGMIMMKQELADEFINSIDSKEILKMSFEDILKVIQYRE